MPFFRPYDATRDALIAPGSAPFFDGWRPRSEAALCAELSRLTYADRETIAHTLDGVGLRLVAFVEEPHGRGNFGFLARGVRRSVLAFRGTRISDWRNVWDDIRFLPFAWMAEGRRVGRVHGGFADGLNRLWPQLETLAIGSDENLLLTGHSLGAALATLAASRIPCRRLITFGSPRVGNAEFNEFLTARQETIRYQHCCDVVCQVPPAPLARHGGTHRYIDSAGEIMTAPSFGSVLKDQTRGRLDYARRHLFRKGNLPSRSLADHTPANYVAALAGLSDGTMG